MPRDLGSALSRLWSRGSRWASGAASEDLDPRDATVGIQIKQQDFRRHQRRSVDRHGLGQFGHRAVTVGDSIYVFGGFQVSAGQRQGFLGVTDAWRYSPVTP